MTDHLTAGISGDELIRRRQQHLCLACGFRKVFAISESGDQPYLCDYCRRAQASTPRFNYKKHREEGIKNLQRLDRDDAN
jgi:hypothetical protein